MQKSLKSYSLLYSKSLEANDVANLDPRGMHGWHDLCREPPYIAIE